MIKYFFVAFITFFYTAISVAQCDKETIFITSQTQLDNFKSDYPCTHLKGNLRISGASIVSLDSLIDLVKIDDYLSIVHTENLTSLQGLNNIKTIGAKLSFFDNNVLLNLVGLDKLKTVGEFSVFYNDEIVNYIGLESLTSIKGNVVQFNNNSLINLEGLSGLTKIEGNFQISKCNSLQNLDGMSDLKNILGWFSAYDNPTLPSISGFDNLLTIGKAVSFYDNNNLTSISGFGKIKSIQSLGIHDNLNLQTFDAFSHLKKTTNHVLIRNNPSLTDISSLRNINYAGGFSILDNNSLENFGFSNWELTNLSNKDFTIKNNVSLTSIDVFNSLSNNSIDQMNISGNSSLSACDIEWLCDYLDYTNNAIVENNNIGCQSVLEIVEACDAPPEDTYFHLSIEEASSTVDSTGIPVYDYKLVQISGLVHSPDFNPGRGFSVLVDHNNKGIWMYFYEGLNQEINIGDSLIVRGKIVEFNGLCEIIPDSILIVESNLDLINPETISHLSEETEGSIVQLSNLSYIDKSEWKGDGTSFNVQFTDGQTTHIVRIDDNTYWSDKLAPTAPINIAGVGSQYTSDSPFNTNYQLFPRFESDITPFTKVNIISDKNKFHVFPNPAINYIHLSHSPKKTQYTIHNINNIIVKSGCEYDIDISSLKNGIYYLRSEYFKAIKFIKI